MNMLENIDREIEKYFHGSGVKQGFDKLHSQFGSYIQEKQNESLGVEKLKSWFDTCHKTSFESTIPSEHPIKDACFLQVDGIMLIGVVSNNQIFLYSSIDSGPQKGFKLMAQHVVQFDVKDDVSQYACYPKHKQKIVNFVRNYRQSVFPKTTEDLHACDFFDFYYKNDSYSGIIAGGSTGFVHFVNILPSSTNIVDSISYQVHGDIIFDIKSLNREKSCFAYKNIVVSAAKDGCIFLSHVLKQEKLVQLKDFLSTSPMSQFTSLDIDMQSSSILSACGDGTIQLWQITEPIKKLLLFEGHIPDFVKVEKSKFNYQVLAQEDIMHTVQVIQCSFYGKYILYLTSQGYITLGTFIEPLYYPKYFRLRKFEKDNTGKTLNFFQIVNYDLQDKISNYDKILYVDQKNGYLWAGKNNTIRCFDLKERQYQDINYNYSQPFIRFNLKSGNIQKIYFNENYTAVYILLDNKQLVKKAFT